MLMVMFSTPKLRVRSAHHFNPAQFKTVTLMIDGHDTRASYPLAESGSLYSYKLKKSGLRTHVCTNINGMILFVSTSAPCRDHNDGTMLLRMQIHKKIKPTDRVALDGGYTLFLNQILEKSNLTEANFMCPVRKQR